MVNEIFSSVAESFSSRYSASRLRNGRVGVSYNPTPDQQYQLLQLILYVLSFVTVLLIFLYIASERPGEKKKKEEEED